MKRLPGNVRQRVKRAIDDLATNPAPAKSKKLDTRDLDCDLHRLRLDAWRIVYLVDEGRRFVNVLAVRRRPPYDYGDLRQLIEDNR